MKHIVIPCLFTLIGYLISADDSKTYLVPIPSSNVVLHVQAPFTDTADTTLVQIQSETQSGKLVLANQVYSLGDDLNEYGTGGLSLTASTPLAAVLEYINSTGDLNLVPIRALDSSMEGEVLYHLGQNTNWKNVYVLSSQGEVDLQTAIAGEPLDWFSCGPGEVISYGFDGFSFAKGEGWASITPDPSGNGLFNIGSYFEFTRIDGISGGAAMAPFPLYSGQPMGSTVLYIPHVAADLENFWTGYSILNPSNEDAEVHISGFTNGFSYISSGTRIYPGEQSIGLIFSDLFSAAVPGELRWVKLESSQPIIGCELFGSPSAEHSYLSGFALPGNSGLSSRLMFPATAHDSQHWTGLSILNPNEQDSEIDLILVGNQKLNSLSKVLGQVHFTLKEESKWVSTIENLVTENLVGVDVGDVSGIYLFSNQPVTGFGLVGDHDRTQLAGYNGLGF